MFLLVKKNGSSVEENALIAVEGIRIYSSVDGSGSSDITISNEKFINEYEIVGTVQDEVEVPENEILEGEHGDIYSVNFKFEEPKTQRGYDYLFDEVDSISQYALKETAKLFGINVLEIDNYNMIKEVSEVNLRNIKTYFGVDTDIKNSEED